MRSLFHSMIQAYRYPISVQIVDADGTTLLAKNAIRNRFYNQKSVLPV
jgi:hypothetical protein